MLYKTVYPSPVGLLTLAADDTNLIGLWINNQKYFALNLKEEITDNPQHPILRLTQEWLDCYFSGGKPQTNHLPLAPRGSNFQQKVWKILRQIPYGQIITYGEIAKELSLLSGKEKIAAQAVGGAVGHNPIGIIIPCHRVIGAHGNLTGYAGGLNIKIQLLKLEGVDMSAMFLPKSGTAL